MEKFTSREDADGRLPRRPYKCIFFDLDHTLWDYECNARETLLDLHTSYALAQRGIPFHAFHQQFQRINLELWGLYDRGAIDHPVIRHERFRKVLEAFGMREDKLSTELSHDYFHGCPKKPHLVPHAREILDYLSGNYAMTVITNGFDEIQHVKLESGAITRYFRHIITSQKAGHKKPARQIFEYALSLNELRCDEALMVGDNLITDIGGARNACIDTVYYNPAGLAHNEKVSHEIRCLSELKNIL